jgi:Putative phage tail protein
MIEVYPSTLPGEPIERHPVDGGTLHDWLQAHCPSYQAGPLQPISASVAGVVVPPEQWGELVLAGQTVEIRPNPRDPVTALWVVGGLLVGAVVVSALMRPATPSYKGMGAQGQELLAADLKANTPRLNGVIPEIAGRFRVYPDYLCQPRRYFPSPTKQAIDVMLCIGRGEFLIDPSEINIGETDLEVLGDSVNYAIYAPGTSVAGHQAHRNWYNAPEVGSSVASAGLRLTAGVASTAKATASSYQIDGSSITIPTGGGIAPQDWEVGHVVSIVAITIADGGGSYWNLNRDYVRGSFGDLGLTVGDQLLISGTPSDDGRYKIITLSTSVSVPGTASTIVGTRVAALQFLASPIVISLNGYTVTLNQDYASAAALATAITGQIGGAVVSESGGVLTITESAPYSGQAIALGGAFETLLGASPTKTTGTATSSYDELTLDKWVTQATGNYDENGNPTYTEGWEKAASMTAGTFYNVEVRQPRVKTTTSTGWWGTTTSTTCGPTEYRITALITGSIPGGTGVVGWTFKRLNPDGTDDASWAGFHKDVRTSLVSIDFDGSQVVGGWLGPFRATPEGEGANLIEFDIFAPMGVGHVNRESGNVEARTKYFEAQWRTNGGAWNGATYSVSGQSRDQLGFTFTIDVPDGSTNIDLRIRRIGAEDKSLEALDRLEWYGLKSLLPSVTSYAGVTTMAVTLEGSDKISSKSENQINLLVTRKLGGTATRSIDDWVRYVCTSIGYASGDLNESELNALAAVWDGRGDWFDHVVLDQTTVKDALATALRAGFAELTIDGGKIRPVRDQIRTTFEHLYTPQNMTSPVRRSFTSYDPDDYDGVDVEFTNAASWEQEVVQCRLLGDTGIRVEKIRLEGVTDRTRAWRIGMRQRRAQLYRRKNFSWATEWDAMNSRYLSYCAVSDDVPGYGQSALLVGFATVTGGLELHSSEPLKWTTGANHVVALRRPDGTLSGPHAATRLDDYRLQIAGPIDFTPVIGGAIEATHLLFGTVERWSYPVLVTEISPSGDSVEVSAVGYDARIYADDDNTPTA